LGSKIGFGRQNWGLDGVVALLDDGAGLLVGVPVDLAGNPRL